jgi:hypothetical protein
MTTTEHALEALHRGRQELRAAASRQARNSEPSLEELNEFGSIIVAALTDLGMLSDVLTHQVATYDENEIERLTIADDPISKFRVAALHMVQLREVLRLATANAERYWSAMAYVDSQTLNDVPHQFDE